jgi:hypothetical protein
MVVLEYIWSSIVEEMHGVTVSIVLNYLQFG